MIKTVIKRNGEVVDFNKEKIVIAITKANNETEEMSTQDILDSANQVVDSFNQDSVDVETIQDKVEEVLMLNKHTRTAKEYIIYREERKQERKRDIFKPRKNLKPYEYPELEKYKEAIQHSYWLHTEYNYTSDIQDYKVNVKDHERTAIKNSMLAIAQIEVDVKEFWGDLYKRLPKPELANVGHTFAESEVRHSDAYAHLLELLGLNNEFEKIDEIPALRNRVNYLRKHNEYARTGNDRDYAIAILLFSAFVEHISLFSQFLIIMSFNKYSNLFSGISNAIEATSKEEQLHGEFGVELINTIREEKPKWFDDSMANDIYDLVKEAYKSEHEVLDWIFEDGELEFMPRYTVEEFIKNRLNNSLEAIGLERIFDVDEKEVEKTDWFDDEVVATKHVDFFEKRSVNYTKRSRSITADDLF
ncbi:ribonucleotide-diphosphate reductase subunit beta [Helcococcus sueciensis]|uniref:ribonucleotide-diphosphate reductase subunit beta n=1 Tax=Helcococcus sueciensis TaxID=241555 RepID=UPI000400E2D1|nr:ribonucleotide-diphosphate reductase subunit beta [Helcococcus sueciensis]